MASLYPTNLVKTAVAYPSATLGSSYSDNLISWTNATTGLETQVDFSTNGTSWQTLTTLAIVSSYVHSCSTLNAAVYYRVRNFLTTMEWSDWTDTLTFTVFVDTEVETVTLTEAYTEAGDWNGELEVWTDSEVESVTMTDKWIDAVVRKTDIAYFMGSATGLVYKYNTSYHGDNGTAISSRWESKEIDFFDLYPQLDGKWKTVDRIWVRYVDKDTITLNVSLSVDNGATWTTVSRSLGTGTGYVKESSFDFRKTGRFFKVRVEEASSDKDFQITDMYLEFYPSGDHFSLT